MKAIPFGALGALLPGLLLSASLTAWSATNSTEAVRADLRFFTEPSCSELRQGVGRNDLAGFKSELLRTVAAGRTSMPT